MLMKFCMYLLMTIGHPGVFMHDATPWGPGYSPKRGKFDFFPHFFGFWLFSQKLPVGFGLNSIQCFWAIPFT